ncbi:MAG: hypothetical protein OXH16_20605 [Gemmatimonadetes bacterium]|nr:hypothetical protein [Gemmatimonadota bacterium]
MLPTPKGCGLYGLFDKVTISYESFGSEKSFDDLLELAAKVYEGLPADDIDGIEKIAHGRRDFLGDRTGA